MSRDCFATRNVVATSEVSVDDAIQRALVIAKRSMREPDWFDVVSARGYTIDGNVQIYQVELELAFEHKSSHRSAFEAFGDDKYFRAAGPARRRFDMFHTVEVRF